MCPAPWPAMPSAKEMSVNRAPKAKQAKKKVSMGTRLVGWCTPRLVGCQLKVRSRRSRSCAAARVCDPEHTKADVADTAGRWLGLDRADAQPGRAGALA